MGSEGVLGTGQGPGWVEQWSVAWETLSREACTGAHLGSAGLCYPLLHTEAILCQAGWDRHVDRPFNLTGLWPWSSSMA